MYGYSFTHTFMRILLQKSVNEIFYVYIYCLRTFLICCVAHTMHEDNNLLVEAVDLDTAILKYNKAILLAECGTKNLGMCYANRAACYMQLKKYFLCLGDIELAKENNYPHRLWSKLEKRKVKCLELQREYNKYQEPQCVGTMLNFRPNEKIPCFANGIEMVRSRELLTLCELFRIRCKSHTMLKMFDCHVLLETLDFASPVCAQ